MAATGGRLDSLFERLLDAGGAGCGAGLGEDVKGSGDLPAHCPAGRCARGPLGLLQGRFGATKAEYALISAKEFEFGEPETCITADISYTQ